MGSDLAFAPYLLQCLTLGGMGGVHSGGGAGSARVDGRRREAPGMWSPPTPQARPPCRRFKTQSC
jgi:hypothetical protein